MLRSRRRPPLLVNCYWLPSSGNLQVAQNLVQNSNDAIDGRTAGGETALMVAAATGHLDAVKYLAGEREAAIEAGTAGA